MKEKFEIKRLNVLMPADLFRALKKVAVDNNCTMTKLVLRAIVEKMVREGDLEAKDEDLLK